MVRTRYFFLILFVLAALGPISSYGNGRQPVARGESSPVSSEYPLSEVSVARLQTESQDDSQAEAEAMPLLFLPSVRRVGARPPAVTPESVEVRAGSAIVALGAQQEIAVDLWNSQAGAKVGAARVEIAYDPAVVRPTQCVMDPEKKFDLATCNMNSPGKVQFNAISAAGIAQELLPVARITFEAIGQEGQTSPLDLTIASLADVSGNTLPATHQDGLITVGPSTGTPVVTPEPTQPTPSGPAVGPISTNLAGYPNGQVPRYEKLELTFSVATVAENLQLPYDAAPPPGVKAGVGISVDALFTPDNWQTVYTQPAFYYQDFLYEVKGTKEWLYPTNNYAWKVRFAPNQAGTWQYKIVAQDAGGKTESPVQSFTVVTSDNRGFVRVSRTDSRYFEFEDGSYFPGLGYNMNYNHVGWINPVLDNQGNFQRMAQNGIQLVRIWLSQWSIYGSEWNPWAPQDPKYYGLYLPVTGIVLNEALPGSEASMRLTADKNSCMFIGSWKAKPATKRNTNYRVRIRYKTTGITGPRIAGQPFGFVAKTGGWLWGDGTYCYDPGVGTPATPHQAQDSGDWAILEGTLNSGNNDFLPNFYLVLENVNAGTVYVDYVWIEEELGNGQYGPNIVSKPWMAHHLYMEQRNSYAFDKVLELAEQYGVYVRPVIHEKNDRIFTHIDYDGNVIPDNPLCFDNDNRNNPPKCPDSRWFYGQGRTMTRVRWLQQAWWRYLQARWGYSTSIHSWELLNEGDPANENHYALADEFGKYMHQFRPNDHLVSTSTWHSFPKDQFWANPAYPNVDFADIHRYIGESDSLFADTALATYQLSLQYGAKQPGGAGKPVIRGETGLITSAGGPASSLVLADTAGIWLHNLIWAGINPGGLIESYWYETSHIYKKATNGSYGFDHRGHYGAYYNFIADIPLNNGHYQDAQATVSDANLRAWGQKDLVHGCAHLWIANQQHTWKNVVDGVAVPAVSGTISVAGFQPNTSYTVEWWDTYQPDKAQQIMRTDTLQSQADGNLVLPVDKLTADLAVRVVSPSGCR